MNTDTPENRWIVVNTSDRYAARKALLGAFRDKLDSFQGKDACCPRAQSKMDEEYPIPVSETEMMAAGSKRTPLTGLIISMMGLVIILFYYSINTTFRSPGQIYRDTFIGKIPWCVFQNDPICNRIQPSVCY